MPTSAAAFFNQFGEDLAEAVHDLDATGHQLEIYLSNATPSASLDAVKADLAEIATGNGYTGPVDVQNAISRSTNVTSITSVASIVFTASGGAIAQFRYVVLMNTTPTSPLDPLILWWDYGSALDVQDGETFTVTFGASLFTITA